jgi:hypothetical protein
MNPKIKSLLFFMAFVATAVYYHQFKQELIADAHWVEKEGYSREAQEAQVLSTAHVHNRP